MANSFKDIVPFLNAGQHKISKFFSYVGLGIGVLFLLVSVQIYIDIDQLLRDKNPRNNGYDFISITKTITNKNMGSDNRFTDADIQDLENQSFIKDVAPLLSSQFKIKASAGEMITLNTDLFLESIKNNFIDTVPPTFSWEPGQLSVPVIMSADLLEMYNVFAPVQDLPQLSESSISAVNISLACSGPGGKQNFTGHIVAVTDRINSVLVPENFLKWANKSLANSVNTPAARIFIKTIDANNVELLNYLEQKNYHINKDKTKFGRTKQVLQAIVSGLAGFGILVILLAMMLFSFYLQLMIARSKDNLQLLITLGYSPNWLSKTVARKWMSSYTIIILSALALTALAQYLFQHFSLNGKDELSPIISGKTIIVAVILLALCLVINYRMIKRSLTRL